MKLKFPVLYRSDMYGKVIFQKLLEGDADVELPAPVKACKRTGRQEKNVLCELEVCNIVVST